MPKNGGGNTPSPFQGEGRGEGLPHPRNLKLVSRAKSLRRNLTDVERKLWRYLRSRHFENIKFRRQYPIGKYIVDFICVEKKLIIELDGGQHALDIRKDAVRDKWLASHGYRTLRFWNNEIIENFEGVWETIRLAVSNPHPNPLPKRERESKIERRDV